MIETVIVEVPNPGHPFGVWGVGEVPIVPTLGAVANAVYDACGARVTSLPLAGEPVLHAMVDPARGKVSKPWTPPDLNLDITLFEGEIEEEEEVIE